MDILYTLTSPEGFLVLIFLMLGIGAIVLAGLGGWENRDFDKGTKSFLRAVGWIFFILGITGVFLILYPFISPSIRLIQEDIHIPETVSTPLPQITPEIISVDRLALRNVALLIVLVFTLFLFFAFLRLVSIKRSRTKEISLSYLPFGENEIYLNIQNNEKSFIVINKMHIGHKGNLSSLQEPQWSRVSRHDGIRVEEKKSRTARFIVEDVERQVFSIVSYTDSGEDTKTVIYGKGVHKFEVKIEYDSGDKKVNGILKWFDVTVNYKSPRSFDVTIKDITK